MKTFGVILGSILAGIILILAIIAIASIPSLIIAGLWMIAGPALATATGVAWLGTLGFWPTFAIAFIVLSLLGGLVRVVTIVNNNK